MQNFMLSLSRCIQHFLLLTAAYCMGSQAATPPCTVSATSLNPTTRALTVTFTLPAQARLYADYIRFSVDDPAVTLTAWTSTHEPKMVYDSMFQKTKKLFDQSVTFSAQAHTTDPHASARLHVVYYMSSNGGITQESFPLLFAEASETDTKSLRSNKTERAAPVPAPSQSKEHAPSYSDHLARLITQTNKLWVRLLLAFLLGILMSLTPCIYPMIPITIGILQAQASHSVLKNALLSLAYTVGIATTFACLGLAAATTGLLFGSLMANPIVILCIVLLLAYLGFSMLGFYDMYVPSFFKPRSTHAGNGSVVSAFFFGVASGSVASPCLSPGLVLLLSIVTTLKSNVMGFILLFMFGVGLSVPLLLIGTFSSSLTLLPRAGMWMVEVKKLFGFMLFGMCFYFLKPIVPAPLLLSMLSLFLAIVGIFYLYSERKKAAGLWKNICGLLGICLCAIAFIVATQAYKTYLMTHAEQCVLCSEWHTDYAKTVAMAQHCNKKLFVDIGASFCSICTAIDKKILSNKLVDTALTDFCCVKIDGANDPADVMKELKEKYAVVGFPTFLLIEPHTGTLIKRWGSELYDVNPAQFAQELASLAKT